MTNTYGKPEEPPGGPPSETGPVGPDPVSADPVMADPVMAAFAARLDEIVENERAMSALAARRIRLLDGLRRFSESEVVASLGDAAGAGAAGAGAAGGDAVGGGHHGWDAATVARRELVFELAAALRIPERTVEGLLDEAQGLSESLPATMTALAEGDISYRYAAAMLEQARSLPEAARAGFEEELLPDAQELTVSKFSRKARRQRERLHPVSIGERHTAAVAERRVWVQLLDDGMADLTARLSAEAALAAYNRLTQIAQEQKSPEDDRHMGQKRADAFADLLLSGDTCTAAEAGEQLLSDIDGRTHRDVGHGIRPEVSVTVPVMTLLGHTHEPGELNGYGPIDPDTARRLAARAPSFVRILVHPVTSAILDVDRKRYRVPADLRTALVLRDGTCRTVGCNQPAGHCDIDHTVARVDGGATRIGNLSHHCPTHHRFKHHTRVRMRNLPGGDIEMTTPSGKVYVTRPDNPFQSQGRWFSDAGADADDGPDGVFGDGESGEGVPF